MQLRQLGNRAGAVVRENVDERSVASAQVVVVPLAAVLKGDASSAQLFGVPLTYMLLPQGPPQNCPCFHTLGLCIIYPPCCLVVQVLLDDYEKGMTSARLDQIFQEVRGKGMCVLCCVCHAVVLLRFRGIRA